MTPDELFAEIQKRSPKAEKHPAQVKTYLTVKTSREDLVALVAALKTELGFDYLDIVTAIDWKGPVDAKGYITDPNPNPFLPEGATPEEPAKPTPGFNYRETFEVVYLLSNLEQKTKVFLKVEIPRADASMPSLTGLFKAADWQEREVIDLMGIRFDGHPNPARILTPDFIAGHPLRKDYVHQKDLYD